MPTRIKCSRSCQRRVRYTFNSLTQGVRQSRTPIVAHASRLRVGLSLAPHRAIAVADLEIRHPKPTPPKSICLLTTGLLSQNEVQRNVHLSLRPRSRHPILKRTNTRSIQSTMADTLKNFDARHLPVRIHEKSKHAAAFLPHPPGMKRIFRWRRADKHRFYLGVGIRPRPYTLWPKHEHSKSENKEHTSAESAHAPTKTKRASRDKESFPRSQTPFEHALVSETLCFPYTILRHSERGPLNFSSGGSSSRAIYSREWPSGSEK